VLKVYFQKRMEMKKEEREAVCAFLSKAHPLRSIRNEMEDSPVPATREKKSSEMVTFFVLQLS
jgi:hypothetical protein